MKRAFFSAVSILAGNPFSCWQRAIPSSLFRNLDDDKTKQASPSTSANGRGHLEFAVGSETVKAALTIGVL